MNTTARVYSYTRFSTPEQAKGDSRRRQTAFADEWAQSKGLTVDATLSLNDLGVSAFRGTNTKVGALGGFLRAIELRKVPPGSYLVVESLDRISRDEVLKALNVFTSIIQAGVTVVTLIDKREYNEASVNANPMDLMYSILTMMRAHDESLTKSKRIRANYENRRKNPKGKIISNRFPFWLKANETRTGFEVRPEKVELVKRIFQMCIKGHSKNRITKTLNQEGVPTVRGSKVGGWHKSAIHKLLESRAVIGEFTPCRMVDGKQVSTNETIKDYFPSIISEETFYKAQSAIRERRGKPNRQKEGVLNNLFSYVAKCGYCNNCMIYVEKGRGVPCLVCNSARRGYKCDFRRYRYTEMETLFLRIIKEVRLDKITGGDRQQEIRESLAVNAGKIAAIETKQVKLTEAITLAPNVSSLTSKLNGLEQERLRLIKERQSLEIDASTSANDSTAELRDMLTEMRALTGEDLYRFRVELRQKIRETVKLIKVYIGAPPLKIGKNNEIIVNKEEASEEDKKTRVCVICLKSGGIVMFKHYHGETDGKVTIIDKNFKVREEVNLTK